METWGPHPDGLGGRRATVKSQAPSWPIPSPLHPHHDLPVGPKDPSLLPSGPPGCTCCLVSWRSSHPPWAPTYTAKGKSPPLAWPLTQPDLSNPPSHPAPKTSQVLASAPLPSRPLFHVPPPVCSPSLPGAPETQASVRPQAPAWTPRAGLPWPFRHTGLVQVPPWL